MSGIDNVNYLPVDEPKGATPFADTSRYRLHEEIAHGGMGRIYRAEDVTLGREVAVKVLHSRFDVTSTAARRFVGEARIAGQLQHPGIPAVHDLGAFADGQPFLVMKLIKGRTLDALLKVRESHSTNLIAVFEQVCHAVDYAHALASSTATSSRPTSWSVP